MLRNVSRQSHAAGVEIEYVYNSVVSARFISTTIYRPTDAFRVRQVRPLK